MNVGAFDRDNEDNTSLIMGNEMALKRVTVQDEAKLKRMKNNEEPEGTSEGKWKKNERK